MPRLALIAATSALLIACPESRNVGTDGGRSGDAFAPESGVDIPAVDPCEGFDPAAEVFEPTCGVGFCHDADAPAGGMDLASPGQLERLRGRPASLNGTVGSMCEGQGVTLDPANPRNSLMYLKLTDTAPCGTGMPPVGFDLDERNRQCLLRWIEANAAP